MPTEINHEEPLVNNQNPSSDDKNIATITHIGGTIFSFVPALIVWILKKDNNAYLADQSREALNFQVTMVLAYMVAGVLSWILIGLLFFPVIWVLNIVFCIIAAISTSKGENYRYPFSLRLIN
ncbi:MAG: DUF4870 domain-containing protein [Methylotenera sp.]|uniref:DUF4870 domain-containing protein n=1 Tax=Methylotenera sp. TaxID=2051956 RepID=UPI00248848D6|nr:DUF4870 domain-containing protein [Methylotenera sp.]MDI1309240.1 DUF4870 domain-containing protein [Methylotenera sp.]